MTRMQGLLDLCVEEDHVSYALFLVVMQVAS